MQVYGIWYGGASYTYGNLEDMEVFGSLRLAKEALLERYDSNGIRTVPFFYLDRQVPDTLVPCVSPGSYIDLYTSPTAEADAWGRIVFGPRGGVRVERF